MPAMRNTIIKKENGSYFSKSFSFLNKRTTKVHINLGLTNGVSQK